MKKGQKKLNISENSLTGSQYSQLVNVSITDFDATLQFVFVNPRTGKDGHVVSRVTMPLPVAKQLAKLIQDTIKSHKKKKDG